MKKTGFTLAEVLITLAIIGVVATMTLPALMNNTQEQQARTGLKKIINTLTHAAETNVANFGFNYSDIRTNSSTAHTEADNQKYGQSLFALLATNCAYDPGQTGTGHAAGAAVIATNFVVTLRDGTSISFPTDRLATTSAAYTVVQEDGLPYGIPVVVDINGSKGPNALSNCSGTTSGATTDGTVACTKTNRVIKDQFGVRLRGIYATPNGPAARWAVEK